MVEFIRILLGAVYEFVPADYIDIVTAISVPVFIVVILIGVFWLCGFTVRVIYNTLRGDK